MTILHARTLFKMKSVLCSLIVLYAPLAVIGCGSNLLGTSVPLSGLQIPLTPDNPLSQALAGTTFQGAVAIEVKPANRQFRLIFRDDERQVSGSYSIQNNEFTITEFTFKNAQGAASVQLDGARKVKSITTWGGENWSRSDQNPNTARTITQENVANNAYLAANADLAEFAAAMDQSGSTAAPASSHSSTTVVAASRNFQSIAKNNNAAPLDDENQGGGLRAVLTVIAAIWAPLAGILSPLLTFFSVATFIEKAMVLRFDGTWTATNANSNLLVTIDGGKIIKLVDSDSGHELTITDSRLDRLDGNRVIWIVTAGVLGQATPVEFTFDVQETSNGSLVGTLTALGANFARVAVTMTRA